MQTLTEPARAIPVAEEADVLVAGGGPAGVMAALRAARLGARVRLIEQHGCLGGVWTASMICWILDQHAKDGLVRELIEELKRRGASWPVRRKACAFDPEAMKLLLEERCREAGVGVRLHTRICAAQRSQDGRLATVLTESKSGREAWRARCFVDASGDGDLAAAAGCGSAYGRAEDGQAQPLSLMCLIAGPTAEEIPDFMHDGRVADHGDRVRLLELLRAGGVEPSHGAPALFPVADGLYALMANHEYGAHGTDAQSLSDATMRARAELHRLAGALRSAGGPWASVRILATAAQIGVRDGRRIHGRYQVRIEDLVAGIRHPDAVCRATSGIDVHALSNAGGDRAFEPVNAAIAVKPYDIPLRALIAADCDGLLLAGRCISGDFLAHASYRTTGNAAALGEAAGACAALAARNARLPHQVAWSELAEVLPHLRELR